MIREMIMTLDDVSGLLHLLTVDRLMDYHDRLTINEDVELMIDLIVDDSERLTIRWIQRTHLYFCTLRKIIKPANKIEKYILTTIF
jgi:hypothetical protein